MCGAILGLYKTKLPWQTAIAMCGAILGLYKTKLPWQTAIARINRTLSSSKGGMMLSSTLQPTGQPWQAFFSAVPATGMLLLQP